MLDGDQQTRLESVLGLIEAAPVCRAQRKKQEDKIPHSKSIQSLWRARHADMRKLTSEKPWITHVFQKASCFETAAHLLGFVRLGQPCSPRFDGLAGCSQMRLQAHVGSQTSRLSGDDSSIAAADRGVSINP